MCKVEQSALSKIQQVAVRRLPDMLTFLKELSAISSESRDRNGVNEVGRFLAAAMPKALKHEVLSHEKYGHCHFFEHEVQGCTPFALMGHLDTVIPEGFSTITEVGEKLIGPGVADMRGGLTVLVWSLRILEEAGLLSAVAVRCLINSDEEINSPWSRHLVSKLRGCRAGFVFEMAGPQNNVVVKRIGITVIRLKVTGKAAHAGTSKPPKSSAIHELAGRIQQLEAMNSGDLLVNVGKISGGRAYNFVPDAAEADFAIRTWDEDGETSFFRHWDALLAAPIIPGCTTEFEVLSRRPPLLLTPETEALFDFCSDVAQKLGNPIVTEFRHGGSDAAFLQQEGIPTLDGMGPIGDHDFSPDEYILINSLAERASLVASCLWLFSQFKPAVTPS